MFFLTHITTPKGKSSTSPAKRKMMSHPASAARVENIDQDMAFLHHCSTLKVSWRVYLTQSQRIKQGADRSTQTREHREATVRLNKSHQDFCKV